MSLVSTNFVILTQQKTFNISGRHGFIRIDSDADVSVFNEIFVDKEYRILDKIILEAKYPIIDIGAHTGMFSIYARMLNDVVPIFAYEPDEMNYANMKLNLKENGIKNVYTKNVAVAGKVAERTLYLSKDSHNHSIVNSESSGDFSGEEKKVFATTLTKIFGQNRLNAVSLVKMDCEGAEFEIIKNLPEDLFNKIAVFYVEYHNYGTDTDPKVLVEIFKRNGFKTEIRQSFYDKRMGFILSKR